MTRRTCLPSLSLAFLFATGCTSNADGAADEGASGAAGMAANAPDSTVHAVDPSTTTTSGAGGSESSREASIEKGGGGGGGGAGVADSATGLPHAPDASVDATINAVSRDAPRTGGGKIACVGDSITFGLGSTDLGKKSYPAQLQVLLGASFTVENDGHSGATMLKSEVFGGSYWATSEFTRAHTFQPDIVIIELGTNDMNIYDWDHHDQFAGDYAAMIDDFRALASHPDVYVALPPWVMTDKAQVGLTEDRMANVIIPAIRSVAATKATPIIDIHALTQNHPEYYHDEIHPNDVGYAAMAATVESAIK
jgi:lysophospholipase L1-like esterase